MVVWSKASLLTACFLLPLRVCPDGVWSKASLLTACFLLPLRVCPDGRVV